MNVFNSLFGDDSSRFLKEVKPLITKINALESAIEKLSHEEILARVQELKDRVKNGVSLDDVLVEAFALVRESGKRTLGQRHYDVQLIGGIALHRGNVAEMKTGEGKTLVATLPVFLNALSGEGAHVVTVNDYLAKRDAQTMGQVYDYLGMSVGVVGSQLGAWLYDPAHINSELEKEQDEEGSYKIIDELLRPVKRSEGYAADITYGTNSEFGFDYLRDNTVSTVDGLVQRGHNYVIVDEVDSILIDEARVPLILSAPSDEAEDIYRKFSQLALSFHKDDDFTVDEKQRAIQLTDQGIEKAERMLGIENIYTTEHIKLVHHLETAVRARALFQRDTDYVVRDNKVIIVDQFTGRMQDGRRWSDGLHQAMEAKENVPIERESKTLASITYQNYFKLYKKLSGMTGTASTSAEEFFKVYNLLVITVPTNQPMIRIDESDYIYQNESGKFKAIAKKVKELHHKGQPVLIGTVSIEKNELLSAYLRQEGVPHEILNAKNHEHEGMIIAAAGKKGAVTIATNMAGRGVDIKLGGVPFDKENEEEVKEIGGLYVLGTERHEARRIDNQLRGRAGRQGDPGETQFYVSLDDSLMRIFGGERVKKMMTSLGVAEDEPIKNSIISKQLEGAQEKIEGFNFDARKHVLQYDDVLSFHRTLIYQKRGKILHNDEEFLAGMQQSILDEIPESAEEIIALKEKVGENAYNDFFRRFALYVIDQLWMQHLEIMEGVRRSVSLRAYGQREPLVEYKKESLRLFQEFESSMYHTIVKYLLQIDTGTAGQDNAMQMQSSPNVQVIQNSIDISDAPLIQEPEDEIIDDKDKVILVKNGERRVVKRKKMDAFLNTGWKELEQ